MMKIVYKAEDGTLFEQMDECKSYEDALSFEPVDNPHMIGSFRIGWLSDILTRIKDREEVRMAFQGKTVKIIPVDGGRRFEVQSSDNRIVGPTLFHYILAAPNVRFFVKKRNGNGSASEH
jgi:hypothetical protein